MAGNRRKELEDILNYNYDALEIINKNLDKLNERKINGEDVELAIGVMESQKKSTILNIEKAEKELARLDQEEQSNGPTQSK